MNKFEPIIKDLVEDEIYEVLDTDPSLSTCDKALTLPQLIKIVSKFVLRSRQGRTCVQELPNGVSIVMNPTTKTVTWNDEVTGLSSTLCMTTGDDYDDAKMILEMINEAFYHCYNG